MNNDEFLKLCEEPDPKPIEILMRQLTTGAFLEGDRIVRKAVKAAQKTSPEANWGVYSWNVSGRIENGEAVVTIRVSVA